MNTFKLSLLCAVFFGISNLAIAQEEAKKGKRMNSSARSQQAMPVVDQLSRGLRRLDLNPEQKAAVRSIMAEMKSAIRPNLEEAREGQEKFRALILADIYDETAAEELAVQEGELATERMLITSRSLSEILGHLTPEQRDELAAMSMKRRENREAKREMKGMKERQPKPDAENG